ncbi:Na+/H+ antiporter subunit A [Arcanobacterium pinnipediorum]|uniref:Na+/H+ antiporter subunit A n=1 Tax=Arcanobacterium pinnipediorum TaxID=1503041 RepID=A0ABY5AHQ2_9ACTO|nr:Na+/H+ antiporter subunit A [Arcanobacterium pinnipediorum]USR79536.1 Na+/H+ antiporter subunit A [Arcanobacterium pinnipediorum]
MLFVLALFVLGGLSAPRIMRAGRLGFLILSAIPLTAFTWLILHAPQVLGGGGLEEQIPWVDQVNLNLDVRIDHLSWVLGLIVTGIGGLVLIYCARYFSPRAQGLGRFAGVFVAFSGAMLGLVTTDNTLALYMYWELTTVFSYLLIGHNFTSSASRRAAGQAIIVTTAGGLAMLTGIIILGQISGGSYRLSELVSQGPYLVSTHGVLISTAVVLVLIGALSKSALIPFHFWLPAAMAAPTPVSAYLHAAAMVKAGVYLIARLAPGFAHLPQWRYVVITAGLGTLIVGGFRAMKQFDLKLVLAFGTVSQLGLIIVLVGYGTPATLLAGLALLVAHALFKSTLFLSVGSLDWSTGTRDLRELSGVGKQCLPVAIGAGLAGASMMGLPLTAGFVAKEAALEGLVDSNGLDTFTWIVIALGSAFTVAYTLRFWWGGFATKPGVGRTDVKHPSWLMTSPIMFLAILGIVVGLNANTLENVLAPYAHTLPGDRAHLAVFAGFHLPLFITCAIIGVGGVLFVLTRRFATKMHTYDVPLSADGVYRWIISELETVSGWATALTQRGSLPAYMSMIMTFIIVAVPLSLWWGGVETIARVRLWDSLPQAGVALVTAIAAVLAARSRRRLKAIMFIGVSGYGVALIYELYGAPDLALTQVLVETMTLVVFILVMRRLPVYFSARPVIAVRHIRLGLAILMGVAMSAMAWLAAGARSLTPISELFHDEAYAYGYGKNIVNVTLVDIRAWDTLGEMSVLVACGIGISSLLFINARSGRVDRFRNLIIPDADLAHRSRADNHVWLAASRLQDPAHRSVIVEVGTRLIFHTIFIVSVFYLFSGHNLPGGGFAGGLLAGIALVLRYIAGGRYELGAAIPLHPGHLMGSGMIIAAIAALAPIALGGTILQTASLEFVMPIFGPVKLATALFFDIGVYIAVVGFCLDIVRSLGAEIDRHIEQDEEPESNRVSHLVGEVNP